MSQNFLTRKQLGAVGEETAAKYLTEQGLHIVARNWRCRTGEIDIVALEEDLLVFVEVRTRSHTQRFGTAQESVNLRKQRQVMETAMVFLHQRRQYDGRQIRFDMISVHTDTAGNVQGIEQIRGAFHP